MGRVGSAHPTARCPSLHLAIGFWSLLLRRSLLSLTALRFMMSRFPQGSLVPAGTRARRSGQSFSGPTGLN